MVKIISIAIISDPYGPDLVSLETELPEAIFPFTGRQSLDFRAAKGKGLEYVTEHFPGVPVTQINGGAILGRFSRETA